jgi:hypothetical protein
MKSEPLSKIQKIGVIKFDGTQFNWDESIGMYSSNTGRIALEGEIARLSFNGQIVSVGEPAGLKWAFTVITGNGGDDLTSIECAELIRDIKREHNIQEFEGKLCWQWDNNEECAEVGEIDLLDHFNELPEEIRDVITDWEAEADESDNPFLTAKSACEQLSALGYSCDYDLSGALVNLQPL